MTTYIATIRHHSISRAPEITIVGTLAEAKRVAIQEFGDGFTDHEIVIVRERPNMPDEEVVLTIGRGQKWRAR